MYEILSEHLYKFHLIIALIILLYNFDLISPVFISIQRILEILKVITNYTKPNILLNKCFSYDNRRTGRIKQS